MSAQVSSIEASSIEQVSEQGSEQLVELINISLPSGSQLHINSLEMLALLFLAVATIMALHRLLFGPSNPDRIVSADALTVIATVIICITGALFQSILYLDVALIYGVLSFAGVLAMARAIEHGRTERSEKGERS